MNKPSDNRFIILRGPSGSGKTTVARDLFARVTRKTVIIHQDYYRFIFNPAGGGGNLNSGVIHRMIEHNCLTALMADYDVILEGILSVKAYSTVLDNIIAQHAGPAYMFYFDIPFEETARRHETRQHCSDFTVEDMKSWYAAAHRSHHSLEKIIPESYSIEQTVSHILGVTKIANP
ncbi:MAG: AAA family ATPase [Candidatus Riflebacteria bacterium]|nr:AAA family ATPase [Candidatus Riflebacteria bacterium]